MEKLKSTFVVDHNVVLCGHVIRNVMIDDQSEKSVEKSQINLLVNLLKLRFHHHIAFSLTRLPNVLWIVVYKDNGQFQVSISMKVSLREENFLKFNSPERKTPTPMARGLKCSH